MNNSYNATSNMRKLSIVHATKPLQNGALENDWGIISKRPELRVRNCPWKNLSDIAKNGANRLDSKGKWHILSQFFKFEKNCVEKS